MFESARLKTIRAYRHIEELEGTVNDFLKRKPYKLAVQHKPETRQVGLGVLTEPLPSDVPIIIGDVAHNLRSALDHVTTEITGSDQCDFPFHGDRVNLIDRQSGIVCHRVLAIDNAIHGLGHFIVDEIKPYKDGQPLLWSINKLNNTDKHKFIVPTLSPVSAYIEGFYHRENKLSVKSHTTRADASGFLPLGNFPYGTIEFDSEPQVTFQVLFGKVGAVERAPVIETLKQMTEIVSKSLTRIEEFIVRTRKS